MKRCPACKIDYFDEMLEFCLDDGAKLVLISGSANEINAAKTSNKQSPTSSETVNLTTKKTPEIFELKGANREIQVQTSPPPETISSNLLEEKVNSQSFKVLEIAPIIISLAHNWWQWVYLHNQYYYSFTTYVFSANFLMWLLLLVTGIVVGLLVLKYCPNKGYAYTGLVVLAINLLLFLVPKG